MMLVVAEHCAPRLGHIDSLQGRPLDDKAIGFPLKEPPALFNWVTSGLGYASPNLFDGHRMGASRKRFASDIR
jgi:hypothetical protein